MCLWEAQHVKSVYGRKATPESGSASAALQVTCGAVAFDVATATLVFDAWTDGALRNGTSPAPHAHLYTHAHVKVIVLPGLETRLRHLHPVEILYSQTGVSDATRRIVHEWINTSGEAFSVWRRGLWQV